MILYTYSKKKSGAENERKGLGSPSLFSITYLTPPLQLQLGTSVVVVDAGAHVQFSLRFPEKISITLL